MLVLAAKYMASFALAFVYYSHKPIYFNFNRDLFNLIQYSHSLIGLIKISLKRKKKLIHLYTFLSFSLLNMLLIYEDSSLF